MEIFLAVFAGMTSELLIGSWHGGGGREESLEEEVITYAAFFCMYLYYIKLIKAWEKQTNKQIYLEVVTSTSKAPSIEPNI